MMLGQIKLIAFIHFSRDVLFRRVSLMKVCPKERHTKLVGSSDIGTAGLLI